MQFKRQRLHAFPLQPGGQQGLLDETQQILAIAVLGQRRRQLLDLLGVYPFLAEGYLLGAAHLQTLALLQGGNKAGGVEQAVVGAGV